MDGEYVRMEQNEDTSSSKRNQGLLKWKNKLKIVSHTRQGNKWKMYLQYL